jgi:hypothetical protein
VEKTVVIAGGGATALELGQLLARLGNSNNNNNINLSGDDIERTNNVRIYIVAQRLLNGEDRSLLQKAAYDIMSVEPGIDLTYLGYRVDRCCGTSHTDHDVDGNHGHGHHHQHDDTTAGKVGRRNGVILKSYSDGNATVPITVTIPNVDAIIVATGREPGSDLARLKLDNAGVRWNTTHGVIVNSMLQSTTRRHVYACGDCASHIMSTKRTTTRRTATHAAWTGYHAVANALLPKWLTFGSNHAIHDVVPRVVYTDPELVSVGMTEQECEDRYGNGNGVGGYQRLYVSEDGTDRSDIDTLERPRSNKVGFVELRVTKVDGRVLGFTACGPSASELVNEMSVVIQNRMTVRQIARSLHSYPSYGYLLHRAALSLALQDIWGTLEACGPVGSSLARVGRLVTKVWLWIQRRLAMIENFVCGMVFLRKAKIRVGTAMKPSQ